MLIKAVRVPNSRMFKITGCILVFIILFPIALFLLLSLTWRSSEDDSEYYIVETPNGRICGKQNRTLLEDRIFFSFRGIPFAKPPVDELRFKVIIDF